MLHSKLVSKSSVSRVNNLLSDKTTPNSPKPIVNGESSNDVESNPTSGPPEEKITNGDNYIVNEDVATNEQVDPSTEPVESEKVSDNETRPVDIPNEPEVAPQALDPATENLVNKTDDNLIEDEKHNESESSEQKQSDSNSEKDGEEKAEEVLHQETETQNKTTDDGAVGVDTGEKEDSSKEDPNQADEVQAPPEKANDDKVLDVDASENKDKQAEDKNESEDKSEDKETDMDCEVVMTSESKVGTDAEKNDLLGAVELTPRGEESVDIDLTNDDSDASKSKDVPVKNASILKSHLSKPSGISRAHQS